MTRTEHQAIKIANVMKVAGCTEEQARAELIAEEWNEADAILNLRAWMATPYIYAPIPYYAGKVLKCQGIATETSVPIVREKHPDAIVLPEYKGDRITADTHELFTALN